MYWKYYRLLNEDGHIIGFMRETPTGKVVQYCSLRSERWQVEPIDYDDRMPLVCVPEGLTYLPSPGERRRVY